MNRRICVLGLFLFLIIALIWTIQVKASPKEIVVPTDFTSIQDAINNADLGSVIHVRSGEYHEDIVINKSVSIIGESRDTTIITSRGTFSPIWVVADGVTVKDITIRKGSNLTVSEDGILVHSKGNTIQRNKIVGFAYGLSLFSSSGNTISNNIVINNNQSGISLYFSLHNIFCGNTITGNFEGIGFYFTSSNNVFYHNNFGDSISIISGSGNAWNYEGEGNYWVNYTGEDLNNDGLGDVPYEIDSRNRDYYPLMGSFSDFSVVYAKKSYNINVISNSSVSGFSFEVREDTGNRMLRFNVSGEADTSGFCRIMMPTELMSSPLIILLGQEEATPTQLDASNETNVFLYFPYVHSSQTVTIISSKALRLYNDLTQQNLILQSDLHNLNDTLYGLLGNYSLSLENYDRLQQNYSDLSSSYEKLRLDFADSVQNVKNITYVLLGVTATFVASIAYLSKRAGGRAKKENLTETQ